MNQQNYTYPVILDYSEPEFINVILPDFNNAVTCTARDEDYITAAQELLSLSILDFENENKELPKSSRTEDINLEENQKIVFVNVWMPYFRTKVKEKYVKKTLTIPTWLDILAKNNNVNFSAVLVKGLKEELNIK